LNAPAYANVVPDMLANKDATNHVENG
jgi:hypothetical protein